MLQLSDHFAWGKQTYLMGILNVTPDSFSGDGLMQLDAVEQQAREFIRAGAHILDIGGESSRPGAAPVSVDVELARVLPVVARLAGRVEAILSVDTYKATVAEAALQAGAQMINDIGGLKRDPRMAAVISQARAGVVIMHHARLGAEVESQPSLGGRYVGDESLDVVADVLAGLSESIERALASGIAPSQIIVDPGIGFGKTVVQNLLLTRELYRLKSLGYPILYAPSRKSFIGYTLNLPPSERAWGTAATVALGIAYGADMVRVHDVAEMAQVARMADAIVREV